jgi:hypothetical protein
MKWWLFFALLTVLMWGTYGIFLHSGSMGMKGANSGPMAVEIARYKAFLWVGLAYFLIAIIGPMVFLMVKGADWSMPAKGIGWSFLAGTVGAFGALFVLVAFGQPGGLPPNVMSIVFAGAPVVNAVVHFSLHPPKGGIQWAHSPFYAGILLAAVGGFLVAQYNPVKPGGGGPAGPTAGAQVVSEPRKYSVT